MGGSPSEVSKAKYTYYYYENEGDNLMGHCMIRRTTTNSKKCNHSCCPTNPTATIIFSINQPTLCSSNQGNNTGFISGQVFVNGSPAGAGVIVSLSVSNPSLGILIPTATITNETGHFTAVFIATNGTGTGLIIATLPECPGTIASIPITIIDCSQPTATINNFNASPNPICTSGTGSNMSNLSGQVTVNGSPAGGVIVQFQVNDNLGTVNQFSTTTDASGKFTVLFTANTTSGTSNVTASLPSFGTKATTSIIINDCP